MGYAQRDSRQSQFRELRALAPSNYRGRYAWLGAEEAVHLVSSLTLDFSPLAEAVQTLGSPLPPPRPETLGLCRLVVVCHDRKATPTLGTKRRPASEPQTRSAMRSSGDEPLHSI